MADRTIQFLESFDKDDVFSSPQSLSVSPFRDVSHTCPIESTFVVDAVFYLEEAVYQRAITGKNQYQVSHFRELNTYEKDESESSPRP